MTAGQIGALFAVWAVAVASPGPDLAVVLQRALVGRRNGLATAVGVVAGIAVWIVAAFVGLAAVVRVQPGLMTGLQVAGGVLLAVLGVLGLRGWWRSRGGGTRVDASPPVGGGSSTSRGDLLRGLATNLANPKALVFFGAVLTPFLRGATPVVTAVALVAGMVAVALAWFCGLAVAASHPSVHARLGRALPWIDVVVSALFVVVGIAFVTAAIT